MSTLLRWNKLLIRMYFQAPHQSCLVYGEEKMDIQRQYKEWMAEEVTNGHMTEQLKTIIYMNDSRSEAGVSRQQ